MLYVEEDEIMKTKRAKCPTCGKIWMWDWDLDTFCGINGVAVKTIETKAANDLPEYQVDIYQCDCGTVLGASAMNSEGSQVYTPGFWKSIDWEQPGCQWGDHCRDCELDPCEDED